MSLFTHDSRDQLQRMLELMMEMNSHVRQDHVYQNFRGERQHGTYGWLREAVNEFVFVETGVDMRLIRNDPNLGGNEDWAADIEDFIEQHIDLADQHSEQRIVEWTNGPFLLEVFDLNKPDGRGSWELDYRFFCNGKLTFWGTSSPGPTQCVDSLSFVSGLLRMLATKDTDGNTPAQAEFVDEFGEQLSQAADELPDDDSWRC